MMMALRMRTRWFLSTRTRKTKLGRTPHAEDTKDHGKCGGGRASQEGKCKKTSLSLVTCSLVTGASKIRDETHARCAQGDPARAEAESQDQGHDGRGEAEGPAQF